MAGEVADGVHVHPLNTPTYLAETVLPQLAAGAVAGRDRAELCPTVPCSTAVGDTDEELARWRELAGFRSPSTARPPTTRLSYDQLGSKGTTTADPGPGMERRSSPTSFSTTSSSHRVVGPLLDARRMSGPGRVVLRRALVGRRRNRSRRRWATRWPRARRPGRRSPTGSACGDAANQPTMHHMPRRGPAPVRLFATGRAGGRHRRHRTARSWRGTGRGAGRGQPERVWSQAPRPGTRGTAGRATRPARSPERVHPRLARLVEVHRRRSRSCAPPPQSWRR